MQRRTSRNLSRAVITAVVLAIGATIWQSWTAGTPGMSGVVQTSWGPLSPADRDLVVKVRLACLWEMSTGQQMQQQATSPAVREAGRKITLEHTELDQKTRDVADKLGVLLPSTPSAQQIGWMKEITAATGSDYDRIAVQRLREAHGIVLPLLATVRVGTRNDLVRAFAIDGTQYVNRHLGYLESTGLVNYSALPDTPSPGLLSGSANWTDLIVPGLVLIACLLIAVGLGATLRGRGASRKANVGVAPAVASRAPRVATAKSLIALPEARPAEPPMEFDEMPDDEIPTGTFPSVGSDSGRFPRAGSDSGRFARAGSSTGRFATSSLSGKTASTGGFPSTRTPSRGVPYPDAASPGVHDTGPRHAVRR
jgi:predicted outer membrane protein